MLELLEGRRIVVCAGSGGVGKTTTAAIAMGMAERGLKVAVVTIDPAKRLADSLGLEARQRAAARRRPEFEGELWALMLDSKRTFDALIERLAPDEATRDEVLSNRIYQQLSGAVAGSQEFTAIAKLYELDQEGDYDLLVLDTPPSRNALDFLDAPGLAGFFQGRAIKMFLRPAGLGSRLLGRGTGVVFGLMERLTGVDLLHDLSVFFRALSGMTAGFTERASRVGALLEDPGTTFLIITALADPAEEAIFFHRKLAAASMRFGGLVVNRLHAAPGRTERSPTGSTRTWQRGWSPPRTRSRRWPSARPRPSSGCAALGDPPMILVPELDGDVHDFEGLARVRAHLFA